MRIRHLRSRSLGRGRVGGVEFYFGFDGSAPFFGMPPLLPLCPFPSSARCTSLPGPRQFVFLIVLLPLRSLTDLLQMHFIRRPGKSLNDKSHGHWGYDMKYLVIVAEGRKRNGFGGLSSPITDEKGNVSPPPKKIQDYCLILHDHDALHEEAFFETLPSHQISFWFFFVGFVCLFVCCICPACL